MGLLCHKLFVWTPRRGTTERSQAPLLWSRMGPTVPTTGEGYLYASPALIAIIRIQIKTWVPQLPLGWNQYRNDLHQCTELLQRFRRPTKIPAEAGWWKYQYQALLSPGFPHVREALVTSALVISSAVSHLAVF